MSSFTNIDSISNSTASFSVSTFPQSEDPLWNNGIPLGVVYSPLVWPPVADASSSSVLRRAPITCVQCSAIINSFCKVDFTTGQWQCSICSSTNTNNELCDSDARNLYPELSQAWAEFADPARQPAPLQTNEQQPTTTTANLRVSDVQPIVLAIDGTLDQASMQRLSDYIETATTNLSPHTPVALMVYSNVVLFYDLSLTSMAAAHSYAVAEPVQLMDKTPPETLQRFVQPWSVARDCVRNVLHTLVDAALPLNIVQQRRAPDRQRALGPALDLAVQLVEGREGKPMSSVGARILAIVAGAPNFGAGGVAAEAGSVHVAETLDANNSHVAAATLFLGDVGRRAAACNTRIDLLACGARQLAIPLLQSVAMATGGRVLLHRDVDEQCSANLTALIEERLESGVEGTFDVWSSLVNLKATRVIGPATRDPKQSKRRGNLCHCRMAAVRPDATFALYFELTGTTRQTSLCVQFASEYTGPDNTTRLRVWTTQLACSDQPRQCIESVQCDVVALLLARREVLLARKASDPDEGRKNIESTIRRIAQDCGQRRGTELALPAALEPLVPLSYALTTGALLGPQLQHADDTDHERGRMLAAAPRDAVPFVEPLLFVVEHDGLRPVAPVEMALWSSRVLLMDVGTALYVWCGRESGGRGGALGSAGLQAAQRRAAGRVPRPYVNAFDEGDSMARLLQCRLYPLHTEPLAAQIKLCPELQTLNEAQHKALTDKLFFTDTETLGAFTKRLLSR